MKTRIENLFSALALLALSILHCQFSIAFAQGVQPIYSFPVCGEHPEAALVLGPDGNFYGTTAFGIGTVFEVTTNGVLTTIYRFSEGGFVGYVLTNADGASPQASLTLGPDGNLYGTASGGGTYGSGTVFEVTTNGVLTILHSFSAGNYSSVAFTNADGAGPQASLTLGPNGNFYGTTYQGGTNGYGTVFEVMTNGVFTNLYAFTGGNDGGNPAGNLTQGPNGNFYGTTYYGGSNGYYGTVFEVTTNGTLTTLASFAGTNGGAPEAGLTLGPDGNFYGTTSDGTVFKVTTNGVLTALAYFSNGASPEAPLLLGPDGNFYGTTYNGGNGNEGTVFEVTTNGTLTTLYSFSAEPYNNGEPGYNSDGANPMAGLTLGPDGNFYGTCSAGGSSSYGTAFRVTTNGVLTALVTFTPFAANPAGLNVGSDGNFYDTTEYGGSSGNGSVFEATPNGALTTLHSFSATNYNGSDYTTDSDGLDPNGVTPGPDGNFYGTCNRGGANGYGTVFEVTTNGVLNTLHTFGTTTYNSSGASTNSDGVEPYAGLALGLDGNFYGATFGGGTYGNGTVFEVTTNGVLTTLHSFTATVYNNVIYNTNSDGELPNAGVTPGPDGNLYGTTSSGGTYGNGTVFELTTNGVLTTLHSFSAYTYNGSSADTNSDGFEPHALALGPDGNFYGTTEYGGANGSGTVFKVTTNSFITTLHSFSPTLYNGSESYTNSDGAEPYAGLALGPDGNFYGTTSEGGAYGYGTVFELKTNGTLAALYSFTDANDGENPMTSLTLGQDGSFYGATGYGGTGEGGVIYRLDLPPNIVQQPANENAILGSQANFLVTIFGTAPSFQWLFNNARLAGATNSTLSIAAAGALNVGNYSVIVTNAWGSITSSVAYLSVGLPVFILHGGPTNETLPIGDTARFSVSATGTVPIHYQWFFNTNSIADTNANLTISPVLTNNAGYYQVVVTNLYGAASAITKLTVLVEPSSYGISEHPGGGPTTVYLASYPGSTNYLYATTNLSSPFSQWQLIGTNVAGSNGLFQIVDTNTNSVPAKFYRLSDQLITP
jgi:uncharacterized repeat protein (TIGR03803 family)